MCKGCAEAFIIYLPAQGAAITEVYSSGRDTEACCKACSHNTANHNTAQHTTVIACCTWQGHVLQHLNVCSTGCCFRSIVMRTRQHVCMEGVWKISGDTDLLLKPDTAQTLVWV